MLKIILDDTQGQRATVQKTWALTQLLTWTTLDQVAGRRRPQSHGGGNRRPFRTRNARQAGVWTLAVLMGRELRRPKAHRNDDLLMFLLSLFAVTGSFGALINARGARQLISAARRRKTRFDYVYHTVMFLCRYYEQFGEDGEKFHIEAAKNFVEADDSLRPAKTPRRKTIAKAWEQYKQAAPYIVAFYFLISRGLEHTRSPDEVVAWIEKYTASERRLRHTLGKAAYVADILHKTKVRDIRTKDFRSVPRRRLSVTPFDKTELDLIESYDPKAPLLR
jgi:hypothetical protein